MILPIVAYGDPVLKEVCKPIPKDYPELDLLIENMFETMYQANGVGLAAPQIGKDVRLFIVDTAQMLDDDEETEEVGIKKVFINAEIVEEYGDDWSYNEGCLSIPTIREDVNRAEGILIRYYDENFEQHEEEYDGISARVILHEYDHIEGILFTDLLKPLKRKLLRKKLNDISKGKISGDYKMRFPKL